MGRKKGSGKAKSAGRKNSPDIKQTEKKDVKIKDDPGGGRGPGGGGDGGVKPAMEIANHHRNEGKATSVSQRQQQQQQPQQQYLSNAPPSTNGDGGGERQGQLTGGVAGVAVTTSTTNTTSTNLKYLHKKFKRIASATLAEEEESQQQQAATVTAATATSSTTTATSTATATITGNGRTESEVDAVASADQPLVVSTCSANSFLPAGSTSVRSYELSAAQASVALAVERIAADRVGDESSQIVTVRTDSRNGRRAEGSDRVLSAHHPVSSSVPSDKFGPPPTVDRGAALIGITAAFDYHQQQQQQQQQQYHQLHPSLHPGVAAIASFPPQSLLVHSHHQLLFGHHSQGPSSAQQQQLQHPTSANSSNSISSSNSVSCNITNQIGSNISANGAVLLPPVARVPSSGPSTSQIDDNCDLGVASIAALTNRAVDKPAAAVQYVVSYPASQHHHHPSALLYANGGVPSAVRSQHPGLSSSSGGSSGSPSPPTAVPSANLSTNTTVNNSNATIISTNHVSATVAANSGPSAVTVTPTGRYVCPYCQMNCSKPSVLEKHIRRHTNERPFKCDLCEIAFKTKSNLYKHRRSRAHASKSQGEDTSGLSLLDEDGGSLGGSDIEDKDLSNSGSEIMNYRGSPMDDRVNSPQQLLLEKPYKPKFHNAAMYTRFDNKPHIGSIGGNNPVAQQPVGPSAIGGSANSVNPTVPHYLNGQNVESLEQHISKLISQNEAIVEVVEAPLQKKYHKITGISRGISVSGTSAAATTSATVSANFNASAGGGVGGVQHAAVSQDSAPSRLANALLHKRQTEEMQQLQLQQQQQQQQQQHLLHVQQQYISYVQHQQQAQPNVINLTSKPVVTPKSMVALQQQQLVPAPGSMIALGGIPPVIGSHLPQAHLLVNGSESVAVPSGSNSSSIGDGTIHFQPLNLTKANTAGSVQVIARASIPTPTPTISSSLLVAVPAPTPPEESSDVLQQHLPLLPYRKRTREPSPVVVVASSSSTSGALVSLTTVCTTTTTSIAAANSVASQPPHVPLHIQVSTIPSTQITSADRPHRPTPTPTPPLTVANHPQNPERSIIKDLLLNSRGFGVVQNPDGENGENLYTCKMCNVSFRDVDSLKYHMICYCQGSGSSLNSPSASSSAPISPVGSPSSAAASYIRSRSVSSLKNLARSSLNPPAGRNPSSLSKLAKSQLTRPKVKPENISLPTAADSPSSSSSSLQTAVSATGSKSGVIDTVQNPLPSPGPLLGNTRLVESGKSPRKGNSNPDSNEGSSKRARVGTVEPSTSEAIVSDACASSASNNLQLFGGEVEVVERSREGEPKMTDIATGPINVHRYGSGGTYMQYNSGADVEDDESHQRELHFRRTLHSGGTLMEISKPTESASTVRARSNTTVTVAPKPVVAPPTHFHFPPINSITAYNPLTLPAAPAPGQASQIVHGGKLIPFVQGIPGPNTLSSASSQMELMPSVRTSQTGTNTQSLLTIVVPGTNGPNINATPLNNDSSAMHYKPHQIGSSSLLATVGSRGPYTAVAPSEQMPPLVEQSKKAVAPKNGLNRSEIWSPAKQQSLDFSSPSPPAPKKSFNFTRMADNISPRKRENATASKPDEVRHFHFDTVIAKSDILIKPPPPPPPPASSASQDASTSSGQDNLAVPPSKSNRFLRPNTLPLKPGTFTPKRHHGITPTNNTMPLISPETPRPSKSCRELYFNGHAYTNIGLKSSTKPFYCTVNKTQPFYCQTPKQLSMYSNWQVHPENDPHPLGLKQVNVLSLYDSNQHRDRRYAIAGSKTFPLTVVKSSSSGSGRNSDFTSTTSSSSSASCEFKVRVSPVEVKSNVPCPPAYVLASLASQQPANSIATTTVANIGPFDHQRRSLSPYSEKSKQSEVLTGGDTAGMGGSLSRHQSRSASAERALSGGFESTEEYTYVRGRGRGKYVCNECGIRCKKPSMLKKHIRTHTDVRPYSCQYCSFHFKTKGNLTKHMKSKSHFKKCTELGLNPVPVHVDDDGADIDIEGDQQSVSSERTSTIPGDSDTASDTDGDDTDDSEEVKSRLPEHEAAEGLLSLSMTRPTSACSSTGQQPGAPGGGGEPEAAAAYITQHINSYLTPDQQQRHGYNSTSSPKPRPLSPSNTAKTDQPRRIITYGGGGPKLEFNLLKHEQYYSDPNVGKRRRDGSDRSFPSASDEAAAQAGDADDEDDTARPIDLTKKARPQLMPPNVSSKNPYDRAPQQPLAMVTPLQSQPIPNSLNHPTAHVRYDREQILQPHPVVYENRRHPQQQQVIVRVSDVLAPITGAANLLTTLVSNTDKIPLVTGPFEPTGGATPGGAGVDENAYFHEYLKERALQDTRIKQSQMKPNTTSSVVPDPLSNPIREVVSQRREEERYSVASRVAIPIIAAKATPPPAIIPPPALGATIPPSGPAIPNTIASTNTTSSVSSAASVATTSTERVYRIFSGKNERHRASPLAVETVTREPKSPSVAVELDKDKTVAEIIPSTANPATINSARITSTECPMVSENASPMDTLAEIAAGSLKLDVSRPQPVMESEATVTSRPRCNSTNSSQAKTIVPPVPESAKTLASEYLKLAQAVTNVRKRTESESALGTLGATATSAEQDPLVGGSEGTPSQVPVVVSTASQQQQQSPASGNLLAPVGSTVTAPQGGGTESGAAGSIVPPARKVVVVGEEGFKTTGVRGNAGEFVGTPPSAFTTMHQEDGGRPVCEVCNKKFHKQSQLSIHMNIHYMERKYRCEPCGTSFRSQGLYLKHERSATHRNKVSMTTTFGVATDSNPRPFYCRDCEVGFRIHGHLAKHLRSKMHVLKLECLGKLPFGTYTEIERSGTNLTEIDTSDCENSLSSLKRLATLLNVKDPAKVLPAGGNGTHSSGSSNSSSSSISSSSSGGAGTTGGTSGNETDSCEDNEEDSSQPSLMVNGTNIEVDRDDDQQRNINNNVKRKSDDAAGSDDAEVKRARYGVELDGSSVAPHQPIPPAASSNC
uniref:Uncharacterized protein n=2 Tax=Anopheles funestus TaxID=62324 RepID=A0A182RFP6_ANOFN